MSASTEIAPGNARGPERPKLRLDSFLKFKGITATGGQAKVRIQAGEVKVNGEVETRRGRGLKPGDSVEVDGAVCVVEPSMWP
jgi:ribosome-associated protein